MTKSKTRIPDRLRVSLQAAFTFGLLCLSAQNLFAADTQLGVTLGVGESDNIRRTPIDNMDETIGSLGIDAAIYQNSKHLYVDVLADISYLDYLNDTYEREVVGNADAQMNLRMVPGRFEWLFQDNFGQVRSDPYAPVTPESRENINYFTTGPDATIAFGTQTRLRILGRYSNVNYETSPVDNSRYGAGLALIREMSPVSFLSFNLNGERVEYAQLNSSDYDSARAYLRYRFTGSRSTATIELGYNQLQFADDSDDGGALVRLDYLRHLTASTTISVAAGHEFTDASASFGSAQSPGTGGTDSAAVIQGSNSYQHSYGNLEWRFTKFRTGFGILASYEQDDYQIDTTQNRTRYAGNINFTRRLTTTLTAELSGDYSHEDFVNTTNRFEEIVGTASLAWQIGSKLSTDVRYQYFDRTSETATGAYKENRVWLQLRYGSARTPLQSRETQPAEAW